MHTQAKGQRALDRPHLYPFSLRRVVLSSNHISSEGFGYVLNVFSINVFSIKVLSPNHISEGFEYCFLRCDHIVKNAYAEWVD
jgi:hypothetical protein